MGKPKEAAADALGPPAFAWDLGSETVYHYGRENTKEWEGQELEFDPAGPLRCVEGYAGTLADGSNPDPKNFPSAGDVWSLVGGDPKGPSAVWAYDRDTAFLRQENGGDGNFQYFICGRTAGGLIVTMQPRSATKFPYHTEKTFSTKTDQYTYRMVPDASFDWQSVPVYSVRVRRPGVGWLPADSVPRQAAPRNVTAPWPGRAYAMPTPDRTEEEMP
jgi:hypothetical protein